MAVETIGNGTGRRKNAVARVRLLPGSAERRRAPEAPPPSVGGPPAA